MSIETTRGILSLICIVSVLINCVLLLHWIDVKYGVKDNNTEQVPKHIFHSSMIGCAEIVCSTIYLGVICCTGNIPNNILKTTGIAIFLFLMGIYLVITVIVFTKNKKE